MAYIITRSKKTGYVQMVKKERVNGDVRTTDYICGLGSMTQGEFKHFQKWAHSITDQELRKQRVLNCPLTVEEKSKIAGKVAAVKQKKTTVKRAPKEKKIVDTPEMRRRKAEERETFRREYEERKGIKHEETIKQKEKGKLVHVTPEKRKPYDRPVKQSVTYKESKQGIKFTSGVKVAAKRKILNERIKQLKYKIANAKSDIRGWEKGTASGWKIDNAHEAIGKYERAVTTLTQQKVGL